MKATLICPRSEKGGLANVSFFKLPPYGLLQLASLTPLDWDVEIIDEKSTPLNFDMATDLVGITATTASVLRAYEIAREFKKRGVKTIMGGVHVSAFPEEALRHADSVVIGEADLIWPEILKDYTTGGLKPIYRGIAPENLDFLETRKIKKVFSPPSWLKILPIRFAYVQATRGCPNNCEFCSVTKFSGARVRTKSISFLINEMSELKKEGANYFVFVDDNIMADKVYAKKLFLAMKKLRIHWISQTDLRIADEDVIDLANESGLVAAFIGFESINFQTLNKSVCRLKGNWRPRYEQAISALKKRGVVVEGAFVFGLDGEQKNIIRETVAWAIKNKINLAQFTILTPLPGAILFERLEEEKRIISKDWNLYNMLNCVYQPTGDWSSQEFNQEIRQAYRQFYSIPSIIKRINLKIPLACNIYLWVSNLEFKKIFSD